MQNPQPARTEHSNATCKGTQEATCSRVLKASERLASSRVLRAKEGAAKSRRSLKLTMTQRHNESRSLNTVKMEFNQNSVVYILYVEMKAAAIGRGTGVAFWFKITFEAFVLGPVLLAQGGMFMTTVLKRDNSRYVGQNEKEMLAEIFLQHAIDGALAVTSSDSLVQRCSVPFQRIRRAAEVVESGDFGTILPHD